MDVLGWSVGVDVGSAVLQAVLPEHVPRDRSDLLRLGSDLQPLCLALQPIELECLGASLVKTRV